jgi:hypothetical protein
MNVSGHRCQTRAATYYWIAVNRSVVIGLLVASRIHGLASPRARFPLLVLIVIQLGRDSVLEPSR